MILVFWPCPSLMNSWCLIQNQPYIGYSCSVSQVRLKPCCTFWILLSLSKCNHTYLSYSNIYYETTCEVSFKCNLNRFPLKVLQHDISDVRPIRFFRISASCDFSCDLILYLEILPRSTVPNSCPLAGTDLVVHPSACLHFPLTHVSMSSYTSYRSLFADIVLNRSPGIHDHS